MAFGTTHATIQLDAEEARIFRAEFAAGSRLARAPHGQRLVAYDTSLYPFADHIRRLLVAKGLVSAPAIAALARLEDLHTILPESMTALDDGELNEVSRAFYDTDAAFVTTYEALLKNVVGPEIAGGDFVFQSTPTIRFHFPNERGFDWNPRFHTDIMLGHPPQEINLWLPVCGAKGSASMSIAEMEQGVALLESLDLDFARLADGAQHDPDIARRCAEISRPAELAYGEILAFDPRCVHATQFNRTGWTRISFDFRVVPMDDYRAMRMTYRGTGRRRMLFRQGHYYDARSSTAL
jgi:hypothetical protein